MLIYDIEIRCAILGRTETKDTSVEYGAGWD